ncbi:MAG: protein kinase domain-containing protein [Bradymonadia bacterium]
MNPQTHAQDSAQWREGDHIDGRYLLHKTLGAGTGGTVYLATDLQLGTEVALKLVPRSEGGLGEEFLLARSLRHPFITSVFDIGQASSEHDYFTMAPVQGGDLASVKDQIGVEGVIQVAADCLQALAHVHSRGLIHGDLKPDNILVALDGPRPRPQLIDFGLAHARGEHALRGTPAYMAPELLGGHAPDALSDQYALGVSIYEALSGANPFLASTVSETLERHRAYTPEALSEIGQGLADVLERMIKKNPDARYPDVQAALHALQDAMPSVKTTVDTQLMTRPVLGPFTGRESVLNTLIDNLYWDRPLEVELILGLSGSGRSRLLEALMIKARLMGFRVISPGPALLDSLRSQLALYLNDEENTLSDQMRDPEEIAHHIGTLAEHQSVLLLIDDLDHCAEAEQVILAEALSHLTDDAPVYVVATAHLDEQVTLLRRIEGGVPCEPQILHPLTLEAFSRVVTGTLGQLDPDGRLTAIYHEAAGGWPGRLETLVSHHIDTGALTWREGSWRASPDAGLQDPAKLIREALAHVPAPVQEQPTRVLDHHGRGHETLLATAALLGDRFNRTDLAALVGLAECRSGLKALIKSGVFNKHHDHIRFEDHRLRDYLLQQMGEEARQMGHRRVVSWLLQSRPDDHRALAAQLAGAGDLGAARRAMLKAIDESTQPLERAEMHRWLLAQGSDPTTHHEGAGDAESEGGRLATAQAHYAQARQFAEDDTTRRRLDRKSGWALSDEGRYAEAQPLLSRALELCDTGTAHQSERGEICFALGWTVMMLGDYAEARRLYQAGLEPGTQALNPDTAARLKRLEGTIAWHTAQGNAEQAFNEAIDLARAAEDKSIEADCLMGLASALIKGRGALEKAIEHLELAARLNRELGRSGQEGKCCNNLGIVYYTVGRWSEAGMSWQRFRDICALTQNRNDQALACNNLGFLYKDRGEFERAAAILDEGRLIAEQANFSMGRMLLLGNLGEVRTQLGQYVDARTALKQALTLAESMGNADEALELRRRLASLEWAEGRTEAAQQRITETLAEARNRGSAIEEGHLLRLQSRLWAQTGKTNDAIGALLMARRRLEDGGAELEAARATIEWAQLSGQLHPDHLIEDLEVARAVGTRLGTPDVIEGASEVILDIKRSKTAMADTQLAILARSLGRELDLDTLLGKVADAAIELTEGERCLVVLYERGDVLRVHTARWNGGEGEQTNALQISRSVADRVFKEGRALVVADVLGDSHMQAQASIAALGLRSILCAPLTSAEGPVGILYVDSRQHEHTRFTESAPVLELLARQAGEAVRNAQLFEGERHRRRLISTLAHDFRTPLAATDSALEFMAAEVDDPELQQMMASCRSQLQHLRRLSDEIVQLERVNQGRITVRPFPFEADDLLHSYADSLRPLARQHNATITVEAMKGLPEVMVDPDRLFQVMSNLVGNAIKGLVDGGNIIIRATLTDTSGPQKQPQFLGMGIGIQATRPQSWLKIQISDDGSGIDPKILDESLGDRDETTPSPRGRTFKSEGLGLSIARELVQRHGGRLWPERSDETGTTLAFTLPVA